MNIIFYTARFNLNSIPNHLPLNLKEDYFNFIKLMNIDTNNLNSNCDFEDWVESVTPILHAIKNFDLKNIFINSKEYTGFLMPNKPTEKLNVIAIGLYTCHSKISQILSDYEIEIKFPHKNPDHEGFEYSKTKTFNTLANRTIYGLYSILDSDYLELLNTRKKYEEGLLEIDSVTYNYVKKSIENNKSFAALTLENINSKIAELNKIKETSFEQKLIKLSNEQEESEKKYFIKTKEKFIATEITIDKNSTIGDITGALLREIDYSYEKLMFAYAGKENLLIQDYAKIEYEYRFFVINNQLVAGAACIEEFTPLNNKDLKFDTQIVKRRNKDKIETNQEIVDQLIVLANQAIESLQAENSGFKNYILDIGYINGKPGIIEINPYKNVGFYALNYSFIFNKLITLF